MNTKFKIELIPNEKMETILPLVFLLNEGRFDITVLKKRLDNMIAMGNYKCLGVYDQDNLIGICGIWVLNKFYIGKHIEADNMYVKPEYRNNGVGNLMINWLVGYAEKIGCESVEANCYAKNTRGKKFWETQGFEAIGYHLIKKFD